MQILARGFKWIQRSEAEIETVQNEEESNQR